ncbi:tyrosine-protein phosphatase [Spiractinospora alimapuensis]|uniref:tyrosine-protein phosphatase n=1 Tax=Spiractinospora alimapuensis TaxID=2820884 RepID=UPI001F29D6F3|nr:tyrosine-protein phosphatase [Spiractinospora alimapuensis]QVQ52881.1 tyrosine-protein phosphatase [Spiractinospora alimapuensis]
MTALFRSPDSAPDETSTARLSTPENFRDLGGLRSPLGSVRRGLVFRSDDLATAPAEFTESMVSEHRIAHVIDLRGAEELSFTGRGPLATASVTYHHIPVADDLAPSNRGPARSTEEMGASYARFTELAAPRWAMALSLVASAEGGVVFHCAAGKDRTGILAALILSALDVPVADISADYARTDQVLTAVNARIVELVQAVHAPRYAGQPPLPPDSPVVRPFAATMTAYQRILTERHGHVLGPVRAAGLSPAVEQRLRDRLIDGA